MDLDFSSVLGLYEEDSVSEEGNEGVDSKNEEDRGRTAEPVAQEGDGEISLGVAALQVLDEPVPVLPVHDLSDPETNGPLLADFFAAVDWHLAPLVPLGELVVVQHLVRHILEDKQGRLVELPLLGEVDLALLLALLIKLLGLVGQIKEVGHRMRKLTELRLHDTDTPQVEPTQRALAGDRTSLLYELVQFLAVPWVVDWHDCVFCQVGVLWVIW